MGKKPAVTATSLNGNRKESQPTIMQSFKTATERDDIMDDSDNEIQILASSTSRATRIEKRKHEQERSREQEQALLRQREEDELQRAIELSRMEAASNAHQEWPQDEDWSQPVDFAAEEAGEELPAVEDLGEGVPPMDEAEEEMDEDALLAHQEDSTDEDRKSVKSEILLDSDEEKEDAPEGVPGPGDKPNTSRTSDMSGTSATFPAKTLKHQPMRDEEEETQVLGGWSSESEDVGGKDDAGLRDDGADEDYNPSQDLFSQGDRNQQAPQKKGEGAVTNIAESDDDDDAFVLAPEDFPEENEVRKSSRLSLKRKRAPDGGMSRTSKATKTEDADETESRDEREKRAKGEIEQLVNGPFTLTRPSEAEGDRLTDNRKPSKPLKPFYCPPSVKPEDYSVAIMQMLQCYFKRLKSHRYQTPGLRYWGQPVHPGPHLFKYPIHRRRGLRGPPSIDGDSDDEEHAHQAQENEQKDGQIDRQGDNKTPEQPRPKLNRYVLDEDDDLGDFEPVPVSGRRKLIADVEKDNKRPRSEPQGIASNPSHPIVRPKPIRKQPPDFCGETKGSPQRASHQSSSPAGKQCPPSPSGRTFDFGGGNSPRLNMPSRPLNQSHLSDPTTSPKKLHRSSSNPEFGSFSGTSDKGSADSSLASATSSPVFQATANSRPLMTDVAGPSKRVAHVQPRSSSPWVSKASVKSRTGGSSGFIPHNDLEGGFIRNEVEDMDIERPGPSGHQPTFASDHELERPHLPSLQCPRVPSPHRRPANDSPGIECPLCGQKFLMSVIEAHASECDGSVSLADAVGNSETILEEPKRATMTTNHIHQSQSQPDDPPEPDTRTTDTPNKASRINNKGRNATRTNTSRIYATKTNANKINATKTNANRINATKTNANRINASQAKDTKIDDVRATARRRKTPSAKTNYAGIEETRANDTSMDHIDAAVLQLVENDEIKIVATKRPRSRASRALQPKDDDDIEIKDFEDEEDNVSRPRGRKKKKLRNEKCFLCGKMIPADDYRAHVDQHQELRDGDSKTSPDDHRGLPQVEQGSDPSDRLPNGSSSSEDHHLKRLYGGISRGRKGASSDSPDQNLEWTQPGPIPLDDDSEGDSPIKAFKSIKDSSSMVDFKNQFKEANSVKSRPQGGSGRGGRRRRGRGRRGRGRRKTPC